MDKTKNGTPISIPGPRAPNPKHNIIIIIIIVIVIIIVVVIIIINTCIYLPMVL
jgi:heme/copper-type cytochrome/quinol oxidase subunit 2